MELAELSAFCLHDHLGPYVWWQAEAWAGKTALLSTFVAHPRAELAGRVWLLSFFITAPLGRDTRTAFTSVVTEQLCEMLGLELPADTGGLAAIPLT